MADITDAELEAEKTMVRMGAHHYWSTVNRAREKGRESTTPAGRLLLRGALHRTTEFLKDWLQSCETKNGYRHAYCEPIAEAGADRASLAALKVVIDAITRERTKTSVCLQIGARVEDELFFKHLKRVKPALWRHLMERLKYAGYVHKRRVIKAAGRREGPTVGLPMWSQEKRLQVGQVILQGVVNRAGLLEEYTITFKKKHLVKVRITEEAQEWLDQSNERHECLYPFWMPTKQEPAPWVGLRDGGYHTQMLLQKPLVKYQHPRHEKATRRGQGGDLSMLMSVANFLQSVPWRVNEHMYEIVRHLWESSISAADLPSREDEPLPAKPPNMEDRDVRRAWSRAAHDIYHRRASTRSRRIQVMRTLLVAREYVGEPMYMPVHADFRGRVYPVPTFLNYQGADLARGLLEFAEGHPIENDEQLQWFLLHGANCWGVKGSVDERTGWISDNVPTILRTGAEPLSDRWWEEADKPWQFLAWCLAYWKWSNGGLVHLPVQMDGSNNGLQLYSLLMRDEHSAKATNIFPNEYPNDVYGETGEEMTKLLQAADDDRAREILEFCGGEIPRAGAKRGVMTTPYNVTRYSKHHYMLSWLEDIGFSSPDGLYHHAGLLTRTLNDALGSVLGAAMRCMEWLHQVADICTDAGVPIRWTSPSGFKVTQEYFEYQTKTVRTVIGDIVRQSNLRVNKDSLNASRQRNGIAPNFIHSIDSGILAHIVDRMWRAGVRNLMVIHDGYGCHPKYAPLLSQTVRDVHADIFKVDRLELFRKEVLASLPPGTELPGIPERGSLDVECVRSSRYAFS